MSPFRYFRLEKDGPIAVLTIARPERMNALDPTVLSELEVAIGELNHDDSIRVAILTGEGKAFVAGADISAMQTMEAGDAEAFAAMGHRVFDAIERARIPIIAAVNGFALGGGCELALACDFIHASSRAKFGLPETTLGLIPGFGGTQRLPRRVGVARARELIYSGEMIEASDALRIGLISAIHEPEELLPKVKALAATIASRGPIAVAAAKTAIRDGEGLTLREAKFVEIRAFGELFRSEDVREGTRAFLEKRSPNFKGV